MAFRTGIREAGRNNEVTGSRGCTRKTSTGLIPNINLIEPQMIPTKKKEWYGFMSGEGETIYKNYKLKNVFNILQETFLSCFFVSFHQCFHCHGIKK